MSFQALNAALTGLRVAQQQLNVISNNVANVGTPGYSRKVLPQSTQVIESTGQIIGVQGETVIRRVDLNLERELWTQISATSSLDVTASYLGQIQTFHGPPDKELSIAAYIADLKDKFSALADAPDDAFLQQSAVNQAVDVADKFNDFSEMLTQLRNDAQDEMEMAVNTINSLLQQIADLNVQIKGDGSTRSTAALEDTRDSVIKELAGLVDITFFQRGDGVMVVQTKNGTQLADETVDPLYFDPLPLGPSATYPDGARGIYTGGDPSNNPAAFDLTHTGLGGKLGALATLRDDTLMQYQAQLDELAHKLAMRFDAQGLRLFTDPTGNIPLDTPPDPATLPNPTPVDYIGFAAEIQVNQAIFNDNSIVQRGTYASDSVIPTGSSEVVRRIVEFTFGDVNYQESAGSVDLRVAVPAADLQEWLGLFSSNSVTGGIDLGSFPEIDDGNPATETDIASSLENYFPSWPNNDQVQITFEEARTGLGPTTITLDLSDASANFPVGGPINDALDQIIAEINSQIALSGIDPDLAANATRNANGQLVIESRGNITFDANSFAGSMGTTAFNALGLQEGTFITEDPYFDVQVGTHDPVRITIEPGDTEADLIDKLTWDSATQTGVLGLEVDLDATTGFLTLRPGMDDTNGGPSFGGDIRLIGGPFTTNGPVEVTLAGLPQDVGIVTALFGSYSVSGGTVSQFSPITDVAYQSETSAGSGQYVSYRSRLLGPGASINTNLGTATSILDYSQKMVNKQMQDLVLAEANAEDEGTLRDLLERQLSDESGVNIDEELSHLIVVQTAYAAAARAVTAADEMLLELLNAIR